MSELQNWIAASNRGTSGDMVHNILRDWKESEDEMKQRAERAEAQLKHHAAITESCGEKIKQLIIERDKALAACAEMRDALEKVRSWFGLSKDGSNLSADVTHAISTDCGKGWASPETIAKWEKEREHCRQQADNWEARADKFQAQVKTLVEALQYIYDGHNQSRQVLMLRAESAIAAVKRQA